MDSIWAQCGFNVESIRIQNMSSIWIQYALHVDSGGTGNRFRKVLEKLYGFNMDSEGTLSCVSHAFEPLRMALERIRKKKVP